MKIAVLGLGLMGTEIALRLKRQGREVLGWNRGAAGSEAAAERGVAIAPDVAGALSEAELVILALADAEAIAQTLFEGSAAASGVLAGHTLIQTGTIAPDESRALAVRAESAGARYLEAPVLGSLPETREGRLIVMAGGDPDLFAACLPVLEDLGREPRLIGPVGKGAALKLAMNQLIAGLTASFASSLGLVRHEGIEVERFMELLRASALYAKTFDKKLGKYLEHDYAAANFPLKHLRKDVRLFRQAADGAGLDAEPLAAIESACQRAIDMGLGDQDYSALYEGLTRSRTGV